MKFCRDCLYKGIGISDNRPVCWHPSLVTNYTDPVHGFTTTFPNSCRYNRETNRCRDGEYWEKNISLITRIFRKLRG